MKNSVINNRNVALAAGCVAINLVAGKVANMLSLPVYLDSIGTILAAALLPAWLAVIAAALTAVLASVVIHPAYLFYTGTQVTIALIAALAQRYGAFRSPWSSIAVGLVIAVAASIVSAPVTVVVFGGVTVPGTTAINAVLIASGQTIWKAVVTGSLFIESIDKPVAALLSWMLMRRLPARMINHGV